MDIEKIARQAEIDRGLEENREKWMRKDGGLENKGIRFYQQPTFQRYILIGLLGIATASFCSYVGYRIVSSGANIIEKKIESLSDFYLEE
ncbi:MAG: hypothetical protein Q8Q31_06015 [Nanoarchaeota archaeon]|nr:hypothetical protein [Nanoarchaeota archaeon]